MKLVPALVAAAAPRALVTRVAERVRAELLPDFAARWARASTAEEIEHVNAAWRAAVERICAEVLIETREAVAAYEVEGTA